MAKYNEILKLKDMLDKAKIPYQSFTDDCFNVKDKLNTVPKSVFDSLKNHYPAYQLRLNENIDVIEHWGSYGNEDDLLEIMGALTEEEYKDDSVLGHLTAEEVFKRFKYCYENNTSVYKEQ